jgi:anti-sigma-K factor RskA
VDRPLSHQEIQELLGAYALDAVEPDEAEAVEQHLRDCPRCRDEVGCHREAAALLAHAGAPAPAGLWDRIAAQLEEEPPPFSAPVFDAAASAGARPSGGAGSGGAAGAGHPAVGGRGGAIVPLPGRRAVPVRVAAAALAAAAVLIAVLGVQVVRVDHRLDRVVAAVDRHGIDPAALAALNDPAGRHVELRASDGAVDAEVVLLPSGEGYLVSSRLPALADDQTYQLWAVVGSDKISMGLLGSRPTVAAFRYSAKPAALAITAERAGGVVTPEHTPIVVGAVPALSS